MIVKIKVKKYEKINTKINAFSNKSDIFLFSQTNFTVYTLNIGTRIYIDSNILIRQQYEANVKIFYNTDVIIANLSNAQPLVKTINNWVSNVTNANIDRIIEDGKN